MKTPEPVASGGNDLEIALGMYRRASEEGFRQKARAVAGLKRYDLEQPDSHMGSAKMVLETHGDWVKFDDLAALAVPEVANLVKALRQLLPQNLGPLPDHFPDSMVMPVDMTVGEIRTARAALAAMEGGE